MTEKKITFENPLYIEYFPSENYNYSHEMHCHPFLEIICIIKGELEIIIDYKKYIVPSGNIIFINTNTPHKILLGNSADLCFYDCIFLPELLYMFENSFIGTVPFIWFSAKKQNQFSFTEFNSENEIKEIVSELYEIFITRPYGYEFLLHSKVLSLCIPLIENQLPTTNINLHKSSEKDLFMIKQILDYIDKNYTLSSANISTHFSVSPALKTLFKAVTDYTIFEYAEYVKLAHAKVLLAKNIHSVTEIALHLGYSNSAYFSKRFKSFTKMTPSEFRRFFKSSDSINERKAGKALKIKTKNFSTIAPLYWQQTGSFYHSIFIALYYKDNPTKKMYHRGYFDITFIDSGQINILSNNKKIRLGAGNIFITSPEEDYKTEQITEKVSVLRLQFYPEILSFGKIDNPLLQDFINLPVKKRIFSLADETFGTKMLKAYISLFKQRDIFSPITETLLRANLFQVIALLLENSLCEDCPTDDEADVNENKILEVIQYINSHYTENFTLFDLAKKYYISYSHLSRQFKAITGAHFNKYVNILRIQKSSFLLVTTDYSIEQIALMLGYKKRSHFTKIFEQSQKISPSQFRKRMKEKKMLDKSLY